MKKLLFFTIAITLCFLILQPVYAQSYEALLKEVQARFKLNEKQSELERKLANQRRLLQLAIEGQNTDNERVRKENIEAERLLRQATALTEEAIQRTKEAIAHSEARARIAHTTLREEVEKALTMALSALKEVVKEFPGFGKTREVLQETWRVFGKAQGEFWENRYGGLRNDPVLQKRGDDTMARIGGVAMRPGLETNVRILRGNKVARVAFATAGGQIYIEGAYLDQKPGDDELAFVLAHEQAHVDLYHEETKIAKYVSTPEVQTSNPKVKELAKEAVRAHYTQPQELEADVLAVIYMQKAGYKPSGVVDFFTRVKPWEEEWKTGFIQEEKIRGHPFSESRMKNLEEVFGTETFKIGR